MNQNVIMWVDKVINKTVLKLVSLKLPCNLVSISIHMEQTWVDGYNFLSPPYKYFSALAHLNLYEHYKNICKKFFFCYNLKV